MKIKMFFCLKRVATKMKYRGGFVSNSSSASFILNLKIPRDKLYPFFTSSLEETFSFFTLKELLESRKKDYLETAKANKEKLDSLQDDQKNLAFLYERDYSEDIAKIDKSLEYLSSLRDNILDNPNISLSEESKLNYIKEACSLYGIRFNALFDGEDNDCWKLSSWTTMYNGYEDVPECMQKIVVASVLDHHKVNLSVVED